MQFRVWTLEGDIELGVVSSKQELINLLYEEDQFLEWIYTPDKEDAEVFDQWSGEIFDEYPDL